MSGTRSPSPRAPATERTLPGLLIAAHGECGGARSNRLTLEIAGRLDATGRFGAVHAGFLRGEPALEEAAARFAGRDYRVYPLFMCDGYYVQTAVPRRTGAAPGLILQPAGASARLAGLVRSEALAAMRRAGFQPARTTLLLVAHGSANSNASRLAAEDLARQVRHRLACREVLTAYLEEAPAPGDVLDRAAGPVIVVGLFAGEGMHGAQDMADLIGRCRHGDVAAVPALGGLAAFSDMVCADILDQTGQAGLRNPD